MTLERTRYDYRKKKKSRIINIGIAVVGILIIVIAFNLFTKPSQEQAVSDVEEPEITEKDENIEAPTIVDHTPVEGELIEDEPIAEEPKTDERKPEIVTPAPQVERGQWQPVGTTQSEPFVAVFEKDHVNWQEMTRAFQHATGIGDQLIIWWVENGGNHQSAVGIVSNFENRTTPYEVRLEWVTNQGWRPVKVDSLTENKYLPAETENN